jgi:hypothetical protein
MDALESLFLKKTQEASQYLTNKATQKSVPEADSDTVIPFEVGKVLYKIEEETKRKARLSKKTKPKYEDECRPLGQSSS